MNTDKKRWIILIACCVTNLCLGSVYTWSILASAMSEYFQTSLNANITPGDLAIVYTIANAVGPITMITGGRFNDKFGPKMVIAVGGILFGVGMFLTGFATNVPMMIVTYGLIGGLGLGLAYGSTISTAVKFFPDKAGLIGGITTALYGLSSVVLPPVMTTLISKTNAPTTFKYIGIAFLVIILVASLFVAKCPDGYAPAGFVAKKKEASTNDKNWKQMLSSPIFYIMAILLTSGAFSGMMVISQASAVAQNMVGMTLAMAGTAVSVLALFNAAGRIVAGFISDRIGAINTLMIACVISIAGSLLLYISGEGTTATFFAGVSLIGISFGSFMGVYPGFTAGQFGTANNSVNYGIMFIGFALAGFFGPQAMKSVYNATSAYQTAFLISCGLNVVGILLTFVYRFTAGKTK